MMNRSKHLFTCVVIASTLMTATPVFADESDILNQILTVVTNISNYLGINIDSQNQDQIPKTPATPNLSQTETITGYFDKNYNNNYVLVYPNTYNPAVDQPPTFSPQPDINQQSVYNTLTNQNPGLIESYMGELGITQSAPTSSSSSSTNYAGGTTSSSQTAPNDNDKALNFDSLLGPSGYTPSSSASSSTTGGTTSSSTSDPETLALNFVRFVSGLSNPISVVNSTTLSQATTADRYDYLVMLRNFTAAQSVGTSNLFQMLARRHVYSGLGTSVGMKQPDSVDSNGNVTQGATVPDASQAQVDSYIAQRRTTSVAWYQSMEKATPITVQRETLYVLAEIQNSLNELKQINERILATLSTMELLQVQTQKQAVKDRITKLQQATTATPTAPGTEGQ